jgi:hypothetical protein
VAVEQGEPVAFKRRSSAPVWHTPVALPNAGSWQATLAAQILLRFKAEPGHDQHGDQGRSGVIEAGSRRVRIMRGKAWSRPVTRSQRRRRTQSARAVCGVRGAS